jgi:hypothetical protein
VAIRLARHQSICRPDLLYSDALLFSESLDRSVGVAVFGESSNLLGDYPGSCVGVFLSPTAPPVRAYNPKVAIWRDHYKLLSFAEYRDSSTGQFHGEVTSTKRHDILQTSIIANCGLGRQELYDLKNDPQERFNLARQEPELVDELTLDLRSQIAKQSREPKLACPNS